MEANSVPGLCRRYFEARFALTKRRLGPLALGDVVNRSNQMRTIPFVVKYGYNADFAGQPPGWVIRRFFPNHGGVFFDRLPVLSEDHRQGRLWDDLVHSFAITASVSPVTLRKAALTETKRNRPSGSTARWKMTSRTAL